MAKDFCLKKESLTEKEHEALNKIKSECVMRVKSVFFIKGTVRAF